MQWWCHCYVCIKLLVQTVSNLVKSKAICQECFRYCNLCHCFRSSWFNLVHYGTRPRLSPGQPARPIGDQLVQLVPVFQICRARESQRERNLKQLEEEKKQNWRSRKSRVVICLIVGGFVLGEHWARLIYLINSSILPYLCKSCYLRKWVVLKAKGYW